MFSENYYLRKALLEKGEEFLFLFHLRLSVSIRGSFNLFVRPARLLAVGATNRAVL